MKEAYLNELKNKLSKVTKDDIDKEIVEMIVDDIKRYVYNED